MAKRKLQKPTPVPRCTVMGLDPSLTGFGVCAIGPAIQGANVVTHVQSCVLVDPGKGDEITRRFQRIHDLVAQLAPLVDRAQPVLVTIEGYSFGSANASRLVELGAVVRRELLSFVEVVEVTPAWVKQFAGGKGDAKKDQVRLAVYKRWGFEAPTADEVDAFVLARIAQALIDLPAAGELTQQQRKVLEKIVATLRPELQEKLTGLPGAERKSGQRSVSQHSARSAAG